jgi:hypothetical protein
MSAEDSDINHKLVTDCISTSSLASDSSAKAILVRACNVMLNLEKNVNQHPQRLNPYLVLD